MQMNIIQQLLREQKCRTQRLHLVNQEPTIISNNCLAGFIYHDLKLKFNSPTINLWIDSSDYIRFLEMMESINDVDMVEYPMVGIDYPVGAIDGIKIYFQHYASFFEAREQWYSRMARIDLENLFIVFIQRDDTTLEQIIRFEKLPFKNKLFLTNKEMKGIHSAFKLSGFESMKALGQVNEHLSKFSGTRYYDQFDWVEWFNGLGKSSN